ncbi:flagellar brake protein [Ectothiorhodospira lacustris]|uniref:flagellar brake protein n=1 Tax=Ectothiorhodospira lacustris TaxID=2899127 RepID=UPI001EE917BF|nr:flagellar brake protein [Ectothiorhodospira lacustris]MCG5501161.1 flagellar brake protein [Ectothiorhodospira lacustris]
MTHNSSTLIRNRKRQAGIFNALKQSRSLLMMYAPERRQQGLTQIIEPDLDGEEVLFDIPNDEALVKVLEEGVRLTVSGLLQGVPVRFDTCVIRRGQYDGEEVLACRWPDALDYQQRRNAFRVQIPRGMDGHVLWFRERRRYHPPAGEAQVDVDEDLLHESRPSDLSIQGMCLEYEAVEGDDPQIGDAVLIRELRIGNQLWSDLRAEVRSIQVLESRSLLRLGVLFLELSPSADRSLNRLLMELQHDAARRL